MKYRENKIKTILLILTFFIIAFDIFLFFYKKSSPKYLPVNNNKQEEIKKNDDYLINYKIYDNDIPQIKLTIYNKAGVVKIIYPDGQIGEYDNKTELETTFNIQENGEYDFIIFFADGKEVTEKVVVNFLSKVVNSQIEENISNINNDNNEDNNSVINPQTSNDNKQDNNINSNNNNNDNNNNDSNNNNNDNNNNDNNNNNSDNNNDNNLVVEDKVIGKVYFNKPIGWNNVYLYVTQNGHSLSGDWPGKGGYALDKNIYEFDIMESMKDVNNITLEFNNGKYYKLSSTFPGYNKLLNITLDAYGQHGSYEWIDYNSDSIIAGGPVNTGNVKNVIFMIGDGMGVNHIKAAEIYQGYDIIFSNFNNTYVSTYSSSDYITDSAASATALATGKKTINYYVGIDYYGNKIETLAEYAHKKGLKTGLVATQTINHATPAGFSAHNFNRSNYDEIAVDQVESGIDLMLGGGTNYFNNDYMINLMNENNYTYINNFNEIYNIDANTKVIGTFAPTSFHETSDNVPSLEEMTSVALNRLDSENGFFLMVEGSNIDTYSHNNRLENMLIEVIEFDKAVRVAKNFVDSHPDTLLIITADHETGRLNLNGANNRGNLLSNAQFTSSWGDSQSHTASFVKVFTYGKTAYGLTVPSLIDNTYIHNYVKQGLINQYGY